MVAMAVHGAVSASNTAGRMCTMPVARMTPAANALTAKNTSPSGRSTAADQPSTGTSSPAAPAARMDAMAMNFSRSAPRASSPASAALAWMLFYLQHLHSYQSIRL